MNKFNCKEKNPESTLTFVYTNKNLKAILNEMAPDVKKTFPFQPTEGLELKKIKCYV